jgi:hypothetical protein
MGTAVLAALNGPAARVSEEVSAGLSRMAAYAGLPRGDIHRDFESETHIGVARRRPLHIDSSIFGLDAGLPLAVGGSGVGLR